LEHTLITTFNNLYSHSYTPKLFKTIGTLFTSDKDRSDLEIETSRNWKCSVWSIL